jgi:hypothetical protein
MGLDQYAYVAMKNGERDQWYEDAEWNSAEGEMVNPKMTKPRELAYWRKHPNLQGWMEQLWFSKNCPGADLENGERDPTFNGIELELTFEDILALEQDILNGKMAKLDTAGFFFGNPSDDHYRERDLEFVKQAKAELFCGLKVFYNSSW